MQSLVALSTTEAKLIALSIVLQEVIHLQNLLLELHGCNFPILFTKPQVVCHTFEDNAACIEVAQSDHKIRPRTKHISVHYLFHFRNRQPNSIYGTKSMYSTLTTVTGKSVASISGNTVAQRVQ